VRDLARIPGELTYTDPGWGFITKRLIAHTGIQYGAPSLHYLGTAGPPYTTGTAPGHDLVTGSKWGIPMCRFSNGAGAGFDSTGITLEFPQAGESWEGLVNHDYSFGIVTRVSTPNFLEPKILIRFQTDVVEYRINWLNSYTWQFIAYVYSNPFEQSDLTVLSGAIDDRWFGLVHVIRANVGRTIYAGTCDGDWFESVSDDGDFARFRPLKLHYSLNAGKQYWGWKGEVGGFVMTSGAWTESEAKRWIMNPSGWVRDYGQKLHPVIACLESDVDTEPSLQGDVDTAAWTEVDVAIDPALDADVDVVASLEGDADIEPCLEADVDICPEEGS